MKQVTQHYKDNYRKLVKRMSFRAGTEWDAEDIVQEGYTRALKYFDSFDGSDFDRWFNTILNNVLREHKNNEKGLITEILDEELIEGIPCTHYNDRVMDEIVQMIKSKPENQSEVYRLFFLSGYSAKDISQITDYTYAATHKMIDRFRNELKEKYGKTV